MDPASPNLSRFAFAALPLLALLVLTASGCAGTQKPRERRLNDAFARIQQHEARISHERAVVVRTDPELPAGARCDAAGRLCDEADALCAIAREVEDADALARCDQASATCEATRLQAAGDCEGGTP
ncbi:MAG: hypothetical protein PVI30_09175 [Myxococcales bacterium]|jgi:hypothetical protein